jgi:hypothetical protein
MSERDEQRKRFRDALRRKSRRDRDRGDAGEGELRAGGGEIAPSQRDLVQEGRPPDVLSPREKSSGHGKKTADKWNQ